MFKIWSKISLNFTLPFCDWIFKKLHRNALFLRVLNKICVQKVCKNRAKIATFINLIYDFQGLSLTQHVFFGKIRDLTSKITHFYTKISRKMIPTFAKTMATIKKLIFFIKICQKKMKSFFLSPKVENSR